VIPDRELDTRLAAAAGVRDDDLPALPEHFLALLTDDSGEEPASVIAARQLVHDAHGARTGGRRRRPGRRALLRTGVAVVGIAAAWATAVLVAPSDPATPEVAGPSPSSPHRPAGPVVVDGMTLVATERLTFPLSVDPEPAGLTPRFARLGGQTLFGAVPVTWSADYRAADGSGFALSTSSEDPRVEWEFEHELPQWTYANADITARGSTVVGGAEADFVSGDYHQPSCTSAPATPLQTEEPPEVCTSTFTDLVWERAEGQWIWLRGEDDYAETAALVAVADSVVDRPRPVDLQVGLAPAGWSLNSYEDGHLGFVSDEDPDERLAVSLQERWRGWTTETGLQGYPTVGPVVSTTVHGRPARMVVVDQTDMREWYLAAELESGVPFLLQVPASFTQDQVLGIAEQVTYTP
jgi:hypothetical protein